MHLKNANYSISFRKTVKLRFKVLRVRAKMYFVILIRLCLITGGEGGGGGLRSSAKKSQILVTLQPVIVGEGGKFQFLETFTRISNYSG